MALNLDDFEAQNDPRTYVVLGGKRYAIPPVPYAIGVWLRALTVRRAELIGATDEELDAAEAQMERDHPSPAPPGTPREVVMLGAELVAEMKADGIGYETVCKLAEVMCARVIGGDKLALAVARGDDPNSLSPANRAERRASAKVAKKTVTKRAPGSRTAAARRAPRRAGSADGQDHHRA